jgi:hypothetical protein
VGSIQCTRKWCLCAGLGFTFDCLVLGNAICILKDDDLEYRLYHVVLFNVLGLECSEFRVCTKLLKIALEHWIV